MKKILSLILTICMLLSICMVTVSATTTGIELPENAVLVYENDCTTLDGWTGSGKVTANAYGYDGSVITLNAKEQTASFAVPEDYRFGKNAVVTYDFYSVSLNHAFRVSLGGQYFGGNYRAISNSKNYLTMASDGTYFYNGAVQSVGWHQLAAIVDNSGVVTYYIDGTRLTKNGAEWSTSLAEGSTLSAINMGIPGWISGYEGAIANIKIYQLKDGDTEGIETFTVAGTTAVVDEEAATITVSVSEIAKPVVAYSLNKMDATLDIAQGDTAQNGQIITYTNGDFTKEYTLVLKEIPLPGVEIPSEAVLVHHEDCTDSENWTMGGSIVKDAYGYNGSTVKHNGQNQYSTYTFPVEAKFHKNAIVTLRFYSQQSNHAFSAGINNVNVGGRYKSDANGTYYYTWINDSNYFSCGVPQSIGWHELAAVADNAGVVTYYIDGVAIKKSGNIFTQQLSAENPFASVYVATKGWINGYEGAVADIKVYQVIVPEGIDTFTVNGKNATIDDEASTITADVCELDEEIIATYTLREGVGTLDVEQNSAVENGQKITYTNGDVTREYTLVINKTPFTKDGLSDEEFFGKWENGAWAIEGKFDYEYNDGALKAVEACVKQGDYKGAKEELLKYYRDKIGTYTPSGDLDPVTAENARLTAKNVFYRQDDFALGYVNFTNEAQEITFDITNGVNAIYGSTKILPIYFMNIYKGEDIVTISSRESENPPVIVLEDAEGQTHEVEAFKDTYITGGTASNFGTMAELQVRGHGYPYDSKESRAYIAFDFNSLPADFVPAKATLKVTGKNNPDSSNPDGREKVEVEIIRSGSSAWVEESMTWQNTAGCYYSWNGSTFNWSTPSYSAGEWLIQVTRFFCLNNMATTHSYDPEETYLVGEMLRIIREFMQQCNYKANRSLDVSVRMGSMVSIHQKIVQSDVFTAEDNAEFIKLMWQQSDWLTNSATFVGNNWDSHQMNGLSNSAAYFAEFKKTPEWLNFAMNRLSSFLLNTCFDDFSNNEGSPSYSHAHAESTMACINRLRALGFEFNEDILEYVERSYEYTVNLTMPNVRTIGWGDQSGADQKSVIGNWSNDVSEPTKSYFKYLASGGEGGKPFPYTSNYYHGVRSATMRSSWEKDAVYMFMGNYAAGHSHPDMLAPVVYAYDKPLIVDNGIKGYDQDPISMWVWKTTEAHNTIEINDTTMNRGKGTVLNWLTNDGADFYEGSHPGYSGFGVRRSVLFVKPDYFIVSDYINPKDATATNRYDQHWHYYHPGANLSVNDATKTTQTAYTEGANIQVVPADPEEITATLKDGYTAYNGVLNTKFTEYTKEVAGEVTFDTVLYPTKEGDTRTVTVERIAVSPEQGKKATAMSINTGDGIDTYYMSHLTGDFATVSFGDYTFDGKLAFVSEKNLQIVEGTTLTEGDTDLIKSNSVIRSLNLQPEGTTLTIDGERLVKTTDKETAIAIYAPDVTKVIFEGKEIEFTKEGDYIYCVGAFVADDNTLLVEEFTTDLSVWGNQKNVLINNNRMAVFNGGIASRAVSGMGYQLDLDSEIREGNAEIHFNVNTLKQNEYVLKLDSEAGKAVLVKKVEGTETVIAEKAYSFAKETKYDVTVESDTKNIRVLIDGVKVLEAADSTYASGTIALGTNEGGYVYFDNVVMNGMEIPAEPIYEDFEDKEGSVGGTFPQRGSKAWEQTGTSSTSAIVKDTTDRNGNSTKALFFDGINSAITLNNASVPSEGAYTLSMWIYDEFVEGSVTNFTVNFDNSFVGFDPNLAKSNVWRCRPSTATSSAGNADIKTVDGNTIARSKGWHHLEMKVADGIGTLYIDGIETTFKESVSAVTFCQRSGWFSGSVKNIIYVDDIEVIVPDNTLKGDADGDGKITVYDAVHILKVVADVETATDGADADGDGVVTVTDATKILRYIARLTNSL